MKAVIYARYSSDNQREESIEGQIRECTAFAEKNGITILKHYIILYVQEKLNLLPQKCPLPEKSELPCKISIKICAPIHETKERIPVMHCSSLYCPYKLEQCTFGPLFFVTAYSGAYWHWS